MAENWKAQRRERESKLKRIEKRLNKERVLVSALESEVAAVVAIRERVGELRAEIKDLKKGSGFDSEIKTFDAAIEKCNEDLNEFIAEQQKVLEMDAGVVQADTEKSAVNVGVIESSKADMISAIEENIRATEEHFVAAKFIDAPGGPVNNPEYADQVAAVRELGTLLERAKKLDPTDPEVIYEGKEIAGRVDQILREHNLLVFGPPTTKTQTQRDIPDAGRPRGADKKKKNEQAEARQAALGAKIEQIVNVRANFLSHIERVGVPARRRNAQAFHNAVGIFRREFGKLVGDCKKISVYNPAFDSQLKAMDDRLGALQNGMYDFYEKNRISPAQLEEREKQKEIGSKMLPRLEAGSDEIKMGEEVVAKMSDFTLNDGHTLKAHFDERAGNWYYEYGRNNFLKFFTNREGKAKFASRMAGVDSPRPFDLPATAAELKEQLLAFKKYVQTMVGDAPVARHEDVRGAEKKAESKPATQQERTKKTDRVGSVAVYDTTTGDLKIAGSVLHLGELNLGVPTLSHEKPEDGEGVVHVFTFDKMHHFGIYEVEAEGETTFYFAATMGDKAVAKTEIENKRAIKDALSEALGVQGEEKTVDESKVKVQKLGEMAVYVVEDKDLRMGGEIIDLDIEGLPEPTIQPNDNGGYSIRYNDLYNVSFYKKGGTFIYSHTIGPVWLPEKEFKSIKSLARQVGSFVKWAREHVDVVGTPEKFEPAGETAIPGLGAFGLQANEQGGDKELAFVFEESGEAPKFVALDVNGVKVPLYCSVKKQETASEEMYDIQFSAYIEPSQLKESGAERARHTEEIKRVLRVVKNKTSGAYRFEDVAGPYAEELYVTPQAPAFKQFKEAMDEVLVGYKLALQTALQNKKVDYKFATKAKEGAKAKEKKEGKEIALGSWATYSPDGKVFTFADASLAPISFDTDMMALKKPVIILGSGKQQKKDDSEVVNFVFSSSFVSTRNTKITRSRRISFDVIHAVASDTYTFAQNTEQGAEEELVDTPAKLREKIEEVRAIFFNQVEELLVKDKDLEPLDKYVANFRESKVFEAQELPGIGKFDPNRQTFIFSDESEFSLGKEMPFRFFLNELEQEATDKGVETIFEFKTSDALMAPPHLSSQNELVDSEMLFGFRVQITGEEGNQALRVWVTHDGEERPVEEDVPTQTEGGTALPLAEQMKAFLESYVRDYQMIYTGKQNERSTQSTPRQPEDGAETKQRQEAAPIKAHFKPDEVLKKIETQRARAGELTIDEGITFNSDSTAFSFEGIPGWEKVTIAEVVAPYNITCTTAMPVGEKTYMTEFTYSFAGGDGKNRNIRYGVIIEKDPEDNSFTLYRLRDGVMVNTANLSKGTVPTHLQQEFGYNFKLLIANERHLAHAVSEEDAQKEINDAKKRPLSPLQRRAEEEARRAVAEGVDTSAVEKAAASEALSKNIQETTEKMERKKWVIKAADELAAFNLNYKNLPKDETERDALMALMPKDVAVDVLDRAHIFGGMSRLETVSVVEMIGADMQAEAADNYTRETELMDEFIEEIKKCTSELEKGFGAGLEQIKTDIARHATALADTIQTQLPPPSLKNYQTIVSKAPLLLGLLGAEAVSAENVKAVLEKRQKEIEEKAGITQGEKFTLYRALAVEAERANEQLANAVAEDWAERMQEAKQSEEEMTLAAAAAKRQVMVHHLWNKQNLPELCNRLVKKELITAEQQKIFVLSLAKLSAPEAGEVLAQQIGEVVWQGEPITDSDPTQKRTKELSREWGVWHAIIFDELSAMTKEKDEALDKRLAAAEQRTQAIVEANNRLIEKLNQQIGVLNSDSPNMSAAREMQKLFDAREKNRQGKPVNHKLKEYERIVASIAQHNPAGLGASADLYPRMAARAVSGASGGAGLAEHEPIPLTNIISRGTIKQTPKPAPLTTDVVGRVHEDEEGDVVYDALAEEKRMKKEGRKVPGTSWRDTVRKWGRLGAVVAGLGVTGGEVYHEQSKTAAAPATIQKSEKPREAAKPVKTQQTKEKPITGEAKEVVDGLLAMRKEVNARINAISWTTPEARLVEVVMQRRSNEYISFLEKIIFADALKENANLLASSGPIMARPEIAALVKDFTNNPDAALKLFGEKVLPSEYQSAWQLVMFDRVSESTPFSAYGKGMFKVYLKSSQTEAVVVSRDFLFFEDGKTALRMVDATDQNKYTVMKYEDFKLGK